MLILSLLLAGCAHVSTGRKFDLAAVQSLKQGETTRAQVHALMGEPWMKSFLENGTKEVWTYLYSEAHAAMGTVTSGHTESVALTFKGEVLDNVDRSTHVIGPPPKTEPAAAPD